MNLQRSITLALLTGLVVCSQSAPPSQAKASNEDGQGMWDEYKIPIAWKLFLSQFVGSYVKDKIIFATLYKSQNSKNHIIMISDNVNGKLKFKKMYLFEHNKVNAAIVDNLPIPSKDNKLIYENEVYLEIENIFFDGIILN